MISRLTVLVAIFACFGCATTIVGVSGGFSTGNYQPTPYTGIAWTQTAAYINVSISASVGTTGTIYLTNKVGSGTTVANEIARVTLNNILGPDMNIPMFSGLSLSPGTYYLVGQIGWNEFADPLDPTKPNNNITYTVAPDVTNFRDDIYGYPPLHDAGFYPPSAGYIDGPWSFRVQVTGDLVSPAPEPAYLSMVLLLLFPLARLIRPRT